MNHADKVEAWQQTCRKYCGKKFRYCDAFWLSKQAEDPIFWFCNADRLIDDCNVWLDEMSERYGDE